MDSIRIPWEVVERVIDQSWDNANTLRSFSLTCRQLHSRSRCVMFARVCVKSSDQAFALVEFLQNNAHLKPFVRSITFHLGDFAPFPLLHILPNVSEIRFVYPLRLGNLQVNRHISPAAVVHQSSLVCLQRFGANIQTLYFSDFRDASPLLFGQVLLAFPGVTDVTCKVALTQDTVTGRRPLEVIRRRISERIRLKTLTINSWCLYEEGVYRTRCPGALLLDAGFPTSTVEHLTLIDLGMFHHHWHRLQACDWSRLRSLVLKWGIFQTITAIPILQYHLRDCPTLKEVVLVLVVGFCIEGIVKDLSRPNASRFYEQLERALLRFPRPRITYIAGITRRPPHDQSTSFWVRKLGEYMPMLFERRALTITSKTVLPVGHECDVLSFAVSPDSKWVATGSTDSTIIVWDTNDGSIAQQWVAHKYTAVNSLAFSPDSRYLISGGGDGTVAVWDHRLSDPIHRIETLWVVFSGQGDIVRCAWSPDGSLIATASSTGSVGFWDSHTFLKRTSYSFDKRVDYVTFSPNGRWLASGPSSCAYGILDVASGTLHKSIHDGSLTPPVSTAATTFDPESKRLATGTGFDSSPAVTLWDVETGEKLLVCGDECIGQASEIQFSPDGKLVLAALDKEPAYMYVWDTSSGVETLRLKGHTDIIRKAHFSPCGKYVASASSDKTVRLWRMRDGFCVATFSEHQSEVTHLAFSPDGKTLSSADGDGTVIIRDVYGIIPVDDEASSV